MTFPSKLLIVVLTLTLLAAACSSGPGSQTTDGTAASQQAAAEQTADDGSAATPSAATTGSLDLAVRPLPDSLEPLSGAFSKYIDVWGVNIVGTAATEDRAMTHAANVMAQYLDADADGHPDNPQVVAAMVSNRATLLMGSDPEEFEAIDAEAVFGFVGQGGQDLYASETAPANGFDASLEEVHHLILNTGWAQVFPDQLGQTKGSAIADAMDVARGGHFDSVPDSYPADAWYTYDDRTCDYTCMITEYTYWAHTSLLGSQEGRADEVGREWRLVTPEGVRQGDPTATSILEDPALGLPSIAPDGNYSPRSDLDPTAGDEPAENQAEDDAAQEDQAVTELFETAGNPDADTVVVVAQGGPATDLFPISEVSEVLPGLDLETVQLVTVHQVQTRDPQRFTAEDLTFEQAKEATAESVAHLMETVDHFRTKGRTVHVAGISYGAFVVQELLAEQGMWQTAI